MVSTKKNARLLADVFAGLAPGVGPVGGVVRWWCLVMFTVALSLQSCAFGLGAPTNVSLVARLLPRSGIRVCI